MEQPERKFSLNYKEYNFPNSIVMLILSYNFDEYPKYLRISAPWHCCVTEALDEYANRIETAFVQKYGNYLSFTRSFNDATPISFCNQRGIRLDRILQCEVSDFSSLTNQTLRISYSF